MELKKVRRVISSSLGELPLKEGGGTFKPGAHKRETQGAEVAENIGYVESPRRRNCRLRSRRLLIQAISETSATTPLPSF